MNFDHLNDYKGHSNVFNNTLTKNYGLFKYNSHSKVQSIIRMTYPNVKRKFYFDFLNDKNESNKQSHIQMLEMDSNEHERIQMFREHSYVGCGFLKK